MSVTVYKSGLTVRNPAHIRPPKPSTQAFVARGKVSGFSKKSRIRFRQLLVTLNYQDAYGVTLTCDASNYPFLPVVFRGLLDWSKYNHFPIVWRKEVQRNSHVHYHLIVWGFHVAFSVSKHWRSKFPNQTLSHNLHSVHFKPVNSTVGALVYLQAHASKSKSYQSKTVGRPWGVVQRVFLPLSCSRDFTSPRQLVICLRVLRKLTGSNRCQRFGSHVFFLQPDTKAKLTAYLEGLK